MRRVLAREWKDEDFAEARKDMDWNKEKRILQGIVERMRGMDAATRNKGIEK